MSKSKRTSQCAAACRTPEQSVPALFRQAALLPALAALLLVSCGDLTEYDTEQVRSALHDSLITTTESWNVDLSLMDAGRQRVRLRGEHAVDYSQAERNETRIRGPVYIRIYDSDGLLESEAWSRRAVYHAERREFELYDSVRVETVTDRRLYSDYLHWEERSDRITSDRRVTIITPSDSISGSGFEGKTDLSTYVITDPRGRVIVD